MLEHERVGVLGRADQAHARQSLVDQEQGWFRGIAVDVRVDQEEVGDVAGRHVPFLPGEHPVVSVAPGARSDHGRVRARFLFSDRVSVATLTAGRGAEVALLLRLGAPSERDRRAPGDVPQRPCRPAPLFFDQHLLERVEALASVLRGVIDRVEPLVQHLLLRGGGALRREPVVGLALVLERDQDPFGERAGAFLELVIFLGKAHVHG